MIVAGCLVLAACGDDTVATDPAPTATQPTAVEPPPTSVPSQPEDPTPTTVATAESTPSTADEPTTTSVVAGWALPPGWQITGPAIATQFAVTATCESAVIVDFQPPDDPTAEGEAQAGFVLESVVQVCAAAVGDLSLDGYMAETYGGTDGFVEAEVAGLGAFQFEEGMQSLYLTQTDTSRYEISTSVVADPALEAQRSSEVTEILESLQLR